MNLARYEETPFKRIVLHFPNNQYAFHKVKDELRSNGFWYNPPVKQWNGNLTEYRAKKGKEIIRKFNAILTEEWDYGAGN